LDSRTKSETRFALALGQGVIACWGSVSRDTQHAIFEAAVRAGHHDERDEALREQLAAFLHDRHPRTTDAG
jgi:hypothetical protein